MKLTLQPGSSVRQQNLPKATPPASAPLTYEQWSSEDTPVLDFVTSFVGSLVGTSNGTRVALVAASAGGAHGAVHAAQIPKDNELFVMAANLATVGVATANYATAMSSIPNALGVAVKAGIAAVQTGVETWNGLPKDTKQRIFSGTEALTDKILPENPSPTVPQRLGRGLVGEAAGAAVGGAIGFLSGLASGRVLVGDLMESTQKAIYHNMHTPSDLQRLSS
jgi:hypothetical protein